MLLASPFTFHWR